MENKSPGISVNIGSSCIEHSDKEKLLGITFDKSLGFNCHFEDMQKNWPETYALARVARLMVKEKLQTVIIAFILSQFNYCPLIWVFHDRT